MNKKFNFFIIFVFGFALFLVYYRWFTPSPIIGGDWPFFYKETLREFPLVVSSWNTWQGHGLGGTNPGYFLQTFENLTVFFSNNLQIPWIVVYKTLWFGLVIFLGVFSSIFFSKKNLPDRKIWVYLLTALIFITNTYVLMLADGGQMGVLLSYSIAPLVLGVFINLISTSQNRKGSIFIAGLVLSIQVMFDPRIAYLTLIGVALYFVSYSFFKRLNFIRLLLSVVYVFVFPIIITICLHAEWILPYFLAKQNFANELGDAYSGVGIVKFLSFGSFSQALSLLHPNWPENIFGKVYFMKPGFLLIPLISFSCLFFLQKTKLKVEENFQIIYFILLGTVGVFFAKGANPPFEDIYLTMFSHVPGFVLFRDSTKFYILIILSYSILIPYSIEKLTELNIGLLNLLRRVVLYYSLFVILWLLSISPAIKGHLTGTFTSHSVPREYFLLKDYLNSQSEFFRTLWIPRQQRFTFYSNAHPSLEAAYIFNASNSAEIIDALKKPNSQKYLDELGVKYILVPYDSLGEIFLKDRKYDETSYEDLINKLSAIPGLRKIEGFGKIIVFQRSHYKEHIYLSDSGSVSSTMISPTRYLVKVSAQESQKLIFSEKYNPFWVAKMNNAIISSKKTPINQNSFNLKKGSYNLEIIFLQDAYYDYGKIISIITFLIVSVFLVRFRKISK